MYQGRDYAFNIPSTALTASATLPLATIISAATIRPMIYSYTMGSPSVPANNAVEYQFQRCTTAGTPASAITGQALDPADPAAISTAGLATFSAGPTLTANAFLHTLSLNQQATAIWNAPPGGELKMPSTAANGIALMPQLVTSAMNAGGVLYVAE